MTTIEFYNLTGEIRELDYREWWNMHEYYNSQEYNKEVFCTAWAKMYKEHGTAPGLAGFEKPVDKTPLFAMYLFRVLAAQMKAIYQKSLKESEQAKCVEEVVSKW